MVNPYHTKWHKTIPDPLLVFGVSGQISDEEALLVDEPPDEKRQHAAIGRNPQYEPSASGVPKRYSDPLAYIGCRTTA
jgi:hypothetical protein